MSPDEIFAAQMWSWPDPIIKRDPSGCVLIVNAMFLQIYGGRVENWAGQVLQGWPAPGPQGYTNRFETRMGEGENEIVYDWVETTLGDGNALALARDVTCFQSAPPAVVTPEGSSYQEPAQSTTAAPAQHVEVEPVPVAAQPVAHTTAAPVSQPVAQAAPEPAPVAPAPTQEAPPPVVEPAQAPTPDPVPEITQSEIAQEPGQPEPAPAPVAEAPVVESPPAPPAPEPAPPPAPEPMQREEREFERRALPIEDGDSVLGTNWRDAVIAKAVGAAVEPEEEVTSSALDVSDDSDSESSGDGIGSGLRILLAEDNAINALLTRTLLEAEGCNVETVEDGKLAVEAVENNNYDLIFMDMRMPNMDGLEATRKIRAMGSKTEKLPIIALTANAFDDDRNACFDSGMNDFMTKPVSAEELVEMVKNWAIDKQETEAA